MLSGTTTATGKGPKFLSRPLRGIQQGTGVNRLKNEALRTAIKQYDIAKKQREAEEAARATADEPPAEAADAPELEAEPLLQPVVPNAKYQIVTEYERLIYRPQQ